MNLGETEYCPLPQPAVLGAHSQTEGMCQQRTQRPLSDMPISAYGGDRAAWSCCGLRTKEARRLQQPASWLDRLAFWLYRAPPASPAAVEPAAAALAGGLPPTKPPLPARKVPQRLCQLLLSKVRPHDWAEVQLCRGWRWGGGAGWVALCGAGRSRDWRQDAGAVQGGRGGANPRGGPPRRSRRSRVPLEPAFAFNAVSRPAARPSCTALRMCAGRAVP